MRPPNGTDTLHQKLTYHPWFFFTLFFLSNSFVAYGGFGLLSKLWVGLFGILVPFLIAWVLPPVSAKGTETSDTIPAKVPLAAWLFFWVVILGAYFFHLTSNPSWMFSDEGRYAFFTIDLAQHWDWRMLWGQSQIPPLSIWFFGFFFKLVPFTFFKARLLAACLSLAAVWASYFFAKRSLLPALSFAFVWILGLSFWFYTFSRYFMFMSFFMLVEVLLLGFLILYLNASDSGRRSRYALLLSLAAAMICYTALQGKPLLAVVGLTLFIHCFFRQPREKKYFFLFLAVCGTALLPLLSVELAPGGLDYLKSQSSHGLNLNYFIGLFWDGFDSAPYGSAWGGCFNSLIASLVFCGVLTFRQRSKKVVAYWLLGSFFLLMLPGLLSGGTEMYRIIAVTPFVVILAVWGLRALLSNLPIAVRWPVLLLLLLSSTSMDLYQYAGPYQCLPEPKNKWRNPDFQQIYRVLSEEGKKKGAVEVLDFMTNYDDHTLETLLYPYNSARNPSFPQNASQEYAVITNPNYEPFLRKAFPEARWNWIQGPTSENFGLLLGIIPQTSENSTVLKDWAAAEECLHQVKAFYMYMQPGNTVEGAGRILFDHASLFQKHWFLQAVFWEQAALYFNNRQDTDQARRCFEKALQACPSAHLYNELGSLLTLKALFPEAEADFKKALQAPVNRTLAQANLGIEMEMEKNHRKAR